MADALGKLSFSGGAPSCALVLSKADSELLRVDRQQAYLLFASLCGNVERTAAALGVSIATVETLATGGEWRQKLAPLVALHDNPERPGDVERALNRAMNFVQAHRLRLAAEMMLQPFMGDGEKGFEEGIKKLIERTEGKDGTVVVRVSSRYLADLAAVIEKAHLLTSYALGDSPAERVRRKQDASGVAASQIHAQIADAMRLAMADQTADSRALDEALCVASPPSVRLPKASAS